MIVFDFPIAELSSRLSAAERSVAELAAKGYSNDEIAATRGTSLRTVANQLQSIYRRLGVSSRIDLSRMLSTGSPADPTD